MTEPTDVRELRERIERADQMVTNLCKPRYTPNAREWTMSIPSRPDHDPDLVIGAGLDAGRAALERLEKLDVGRKNALRGTVAGYIERLADLLSPAWRDDYTSYLRVANCINCLSDTLATPRTSTAAGRDE